MQRNREKLKKRIDAFHTSEEKEVDVELDGWIDNIAWTAHIPRTGE